MGFIRYELISGGTTTDKEAAVKAAIERAASRKAPEYVVARYMDGSTRAVQYNPDGTFERLWDDPIRPGCKVYLPEYGIVKVVAIYADKAEASIDGYDEETDFIQGGYTFMGGEYGEDEMRFVAVPYEETPGSRA